MICDCVVVLRIPETMWAHYAISRFHDYVMQSRNCVNSKITCIHEGGLIQRHNYMRVDSGIRVALYLTVCMGLIRVMRVSRPREESDDPPNSVRTCTFSAFLHRVYH